MDNKERFELMKEIQDKDLTVRRYINIYRYQNLTTRSQI